MDASIERLLAFLKCSVDATVFRAHDSCRVYFSGPDRAEQRALHAARRFLHTEPCVRARLGRPLLVVVVDLSDAGSPALALLRHAPRPRAAFMVRSAVHAPVPQQVGEADIDDLSMCMATSLRIDDAEMGGIGDTEGCGGATASTVPSASRGGGGGVTSSGSTAAGPNIRVTMPPMALDVGSRAGLQRAVRSLEGALGDFARSELGLVVVLGAAAPRRPPRKKGAAAAVGGMDDEEDDDDEDDGDDDGDDGDGDDEDISGGSGAGGGAARGDQMYLLSPEEDLLEALEREQRARGVRAGTRPALTAQPFDAAPPGDPSKTPNWVWHSLWTDQSTFTGREAGFGGRATRRPPSWGGAVVSGPHRDGARASPALLSNWAWPQGDARDALLRVPRNMSTSFDIDADAIKDADDDPSSKNDNGGDGGGDNGSGAEGDSEGDSDSDSDIIDGRVLRRKRRAGRMEPALKISGGSGQQNSFDAAVAGASEGRDDFLGRAMKRCRIANGAPSLRGTKGVSLNGGSDVADGLRRKKRFALVPGGNGAHDDGVNSGSTSVDGVDESLMNGDAFGTAVALEDTPPRKRQVGRHAALFHRPQMDRPEAAAAADAADAAEAHAAVAGTPAETDPAEVKDDSDTTPLKSPGEQELLHDGSTDTNATDGEDDDDIDDDDDDNDDDAYDGASGGGFSAAGSKTRSRQFGSFEAHRKTRARVNSAPEHLSGGLGAADGSTDVDDAPLGAYRASRAGGFEASGAKRRHLSTSTDNKTAVLAGTLAGTVNGGGGGGGGGGGDGGLESRRTAPEGHPEHSTNPRLAMHRLVSAFVGKGAGSDEESDEDPTVVP